MICPSVADRRHVPGPHDLAHETLDELIKQINIDA
jgi:hypothetical protein